MNDLVLCFLSYHGDETQFAKARRPVTLKLVDRLFKFLQ